MESRGAVQTDWLQRKELNTWNGKVPDKILKNPEYAEILAAIEELENIRKYFNTVEEPELIEYAIYREKAAITRLSYLFRKFKMERMCEVDKTVGSKLK